MSVKLEKGVVEGQCDSRFERVLDAFVANFQAHGEVGANVTIVHEGRTVVDLWGGIARRDEPWTRDTICIVHSCTKGATALCAHLLAAQGRLDLDAPVAEIWPEFAVAGKEATTVRMMLDHSSPVPVLRTKIPDGGYADWNLMCDLLAAEEAFWHPGSSQGYHGFVFGWTVGELVRRVDGRGLGQFFREEFADPLGIDFFIGLPESEEPRVASIIGFRPPKDRPLSPFLHSVLREKGSVPNLFMNNSGGFMAGGANSREGHAAEIGAANGMTNGRGLAGLYAPLAAGGGGRFRAADIDRMRAASACTHLDETLKMPTRFGLGFMLSMDNRRRNGSSAIIGRNAFGHVGAGGSIGFADVEAGMSFGYAMNQMGDGILMNERGQALIDAAYACLGWQGCDAGAWQP
ncbi:serine hydrolase domain-containing protein [Zavarzinia sp. CC-PAN008]|uniref:serine hydrolase domain-containing protein n=1 Tax=Zavarzinia sp. CC-PAN008 TaxID=3243332 RepID=UPI003F7438C4